MKLSEFSSAYFAFLLRGKAEDFELAWETYAAAKTSGATVSELQTQMDDSHTSAELLCLLIEDGVGDIH